MYSRGSILKFTTLLSDRRSFLSVLEITIECLDALNREYEIRYSLSHISYLLRRLRDLQLHLCTYPALVCTGAGAPLKRKKITGNLCGETVEACCI